MTSSAARMGNSSIGPGQMQECASQQTVATEDMSVSVGQYDRPEKAQHAQHDSGSIGEGTVVENSPNDDVESGAAFQPAEQPSLHAGQQKSAVQASTMEAKPRSAAGNGWSSHTSDTDPGMELLDSGSMGAAAEGRVENPDGASAEPKADAAESAAAPKRPRLAAKQRRTVLRQHGEMVRQVQVLLQILQRQIKLAGKDPLAEQEVQQQQAEVLASVTTPEQRPAAAASSQAAAAPVAPPVKAIPAFIPKPGKLTPEAEAKLLIHFGLQDTLTREETQALAAQVGASEAAVRDHIGKLRGNMRAALQRLQRKATSGSPAGAPPRAHAHHAAPGAQPGASHAPHQQQPAPMCPSQPQSGNATMPGTAHAQQQGTARQFMTATGTAQERLPVHSTIQTQQLHAGPSPSLAGGYGAPQTLDLSGLQAILRNAGLSQAVQMDAAKDSASGAAPAAPAAAASQQGQVPQPSLSSVAHSSAPESNATPSAPAAASPAVVVPPLQRAPAAGLSLSATSPSAAAAALAAIDKACAQDTAMLSSMLDPQRGIRHDCTGKLAGALIGMKTAEGRHETLLAMLHTTPTVSLMPVALSQRCLDVLAEWVRWGMIDRQTTILRLLLGVLLRLPIPPAMLHTGSLLRAVSSMQSYKVPSVSYGATNLLHHWQQQEPSLWPSAPKKHPAPSPSVAPAAYDRPRQQPAPRPSAGLAATTNGVGVNHSSTTAKQQPPALSRAFYRGVAGRTGAEQPAKSVSAKPLTADEIVQSQLRKRQAGSALPKGVPGKVPRLDNKSLLEAAGKRRQGAARHGAMGNGPSSPRMGQQRSKQPPALTQQLQSSSALQAPGTAASAPGAQPALSAAALQALVWAAQGIGKIGSADPRQKGGTAAHQPAKHGHGPALEPRLTLDWCQPPVIDVQHEADMELGQGADSCERHTQQMRQASQPEALYVLPELIPATPGEPWHAAEEENQALHSVPPPVPLLPTDPEEAKATYQWLHSLQLPQDTIMGRLAGK